MKQKLLLYFLLITVISFNNSSLTINNISSIDYNSQRHEINWEILYGTLYEEGSFSGILIEDGFVFVGYGYPNGSETADMWLVRTDQGGIVRWDKYYDGGGDEYAYSVVQTDDKGFLLAGISLFSNEYDIYVVKTHSNGDLDWEQKIGGEGDQRTRSIIKTSDGNYLIVGSKNIQKYSESDLWMIKINESGDEIWNETYGGGDFDHGRSVYETNDSGFIITGETKSFTNTKTDIWLVKTNNQGIVQWNYTFDFGNRSDYGYSVIQTSDGGFLLTGTGAAIDFMNLVLIKTDFNGIVQWNKTYIKGEQTEGFSVIETGEGEFIAVGWSGENGMDMYLIKTDTKGNLLYSTHFGGADMDYAYTIIEAKDNQFLVIGKTESYGIDKKYDLWVLNIFFTEITKTTTSTSITTTATKTTTTTHPSGFFITSGLEIQTLVFSICGIFLILKRYKKKPIQKK